MRGIMVSAAFLVAIDRRWKDGFFAGHSVKNISLWPELLPFSAVRHCTCGIKNGHVARYSSRRGGTKPLVSSTSSVTAGLAADLKSSDGGGYLLLATRGSCKPILGIGGRTFGFLVFWQNVREGSQQYI